MTVLKRKDFARWQAGERLPDEALCNAVKEMEDGLTDADLGGFLYKKRVARPGGGKSGGYRTILSARIGQRYVFLHGFAKKDKANIALTELRLHGTSYLESMHTSDVFDTTHPWPARIDLPGISQRWAEYLELAD